MGRSVSTPSEARVVCYRDVSDFEDEFDWENLVDDIRESCKSQWPSFDDCDEWLDSEDHALVENSLCYVGISEYCGCAAIWISSKSDELLSTGYDENASRANLCDSFIEKIRPKFEKFFGEYVKVGSFSNGEAVYEKAS